MPATKPFLFRTLRLCVFARTLGLCAAVLWTACRTPEAPAPFLCGADRLFEAPYFDWVRGRRVGLITNQTGVDSGLHLTADRLEDHPEVSLVAVFGPEHGFQGAAEAGDEVASQGRVFSLYGENRAPTPEMLAGVDLLIYDIQDVGSRYYTFISTMLECLRAAARQGIPFIVLDRPAPLDGVSLEGPVLEAGFESFVGVHRLPVRYGMTPGETARLLNAELEIGADLKVVPLQGWRRSQWYDDTGLEWIAPSPNMPTLSTATVYPGFCLIEGTNLSEGRGSTRPFELLGAPWLKSDLLASRLNQLGLEGVRFRPQGFQPSFSKYSGQYCAGLQVHVTDRSRFRSVRAALHVLQETMRLQPKEFAFQDEAFDRLIGNSWVRQDLLQGVPADQIVERWQDGLEDFRTRRSKYLIYR